MAPGRTRTQQGKENQPPNGTDIGRLIDTKLKEVLGGVEMERTRTDKKMYDDIKRDVKKELEDFLRTLVEEKLAGWNHTEPGTGMVFPATNCDKGSTGIYKTLKEAEREHNTIKQLSVR